MAGDDEAAEVAPCCCLIPGATQKIGNGSGGILLEHLSAQTEVVEMGLNACVPH